MEKADTSIETKGHLHSSSKLEYTDATNSAHNITKTHPAQAEARTRNYRSAQRQQILFPLLAISPQSTGTIWCPLKILQPHKVSRAILKQRSSIMWVGTQLSGWVCPADSQSPLSIISASTHRLMCWHKVSS